LTHVLAHHERQRTQRVKPPAPPAPGYRPEVLATLFGLPLVGDDGLWTQTASGSRLPSVSIEASEEARKFLESARDDRDYLYGAYVLVLVLGLRKGEVLGLTWEHIDWDGWDKACGEHSEEFCDQCRARHEVSLRIDKQLQRVRGQLLHRETKTEDSDAPLPLPDICVTALRRRYLDQQRAAESVGYRWHPTGMIFTTRYGQPIEPRNFNRS
jgi:integrase